MDVVDLLIMEAAPLENMDSSNRVSVEVKPTREGR